MDARLRESISQIQFDCWSDKGSHQPEKSSCQECNNQITELFKQEIAKALESGSDINVTTKPTDKEIQDILVAYKRRDAFATGNSGTTLKRAIEMVRELYE